MKHLSSLDSFSFSTLLYQDIIALFVDVRVSAFVKLSFIAVVTADDFAVANTEDSFVFRVQIIFMLSSYS